jgi:hypothetical protein
MTTATILSWVLAAAPEHQPQTEFADELASVEVSGTSDEFQLVAYDATGDPIGSVALWTDGAEMHIASDFADGYEEIAILDEDVRNDSILAPGVATERAQSMLDILAQSDPQEGKVMGSTYHTACACAEFIGTEPPEDWC